jgi:hypothetical protein
MKHFYRILSDAPPVQLSESREKEKLYASIYFVNCSLLLACLFRIKSRAIMNATVSLMCKKFNIAHITVLKDMKLGILTYHDKWHM